MRLYEELETGVECERLAPTLQALAQGTASSESLLELRPHLRNCAGCRATVRALHTSHLGRLSAIAAAVIAPARAFVDRLRSGSGAAGPDAPVELHPMDRQEDVDELFRRLNGADSAVQPIAPSVAEGVGRISTVRVNLRGWAETALHRLQSSDLAIGVHAASTGGGGRITSIAALIGICVSGVGAGTYCVATALLPDPKPAIRSEAKAAKKTATRSSGTPRVARASRTPHPQLPAVSQTRPVSTPVAARQSPASAKSRKPAAQDEFSFETHSPRGTAQARASSAATSASASGGSFESGNAPQRSAGSSEFSDGSGGEFSP